MGKKEKLIQACKDSYIIDKPDDTEKEYTYKDHLQDEHTKQEYFNDTVDIIRGELEKFVEDNAISLLEYIDDNNISNFLAQVLQQ